MILGRYKAHIPFVIIPFAAFGYWAVIPGTNLRLFIELYIVRGILDAIFALVLALYTDEIEVSCTALASIL